MRIVAVSDLHCGHGRYERVRELARLAARASGDVLVLAGDVTNFDLDDAARALRWFRVSAPVKLMVAGNHDVWSPGGRGTVKRYRRWLARLAAAYGFHYLDAGPALVGEVGFAGCMGWYDYSLRQLEEPVPGVKVAVARPAHRSGLTRLVELPGRSEISWSELRAEDFRHKALMWREDGRVNYVMWNDAIYADWRREDAEVAEQMAEHLQQSARALARAEALVAVTHMVPFAEAFTRPYRRVDYGFCRAYMGSAALGGALAGDERLVVWICGHVHHRIVVNCRGIPVANVSSAPEQAPMVTVIDIEGGQLARMARLGPAGWQEVEVVGAKASR